MTDARKTLRLLIPEALHIFEAADGLSLESYAAQTAFSVSPKTSTSPLQSGHDLIDMAVKECSRLQGEHVGQALRIELETAFHAQTANHHGVDFHPEFFQGNLLFAMRCHHAVPVFSCGGVPADNVAFPRGILLSRGQPGDNRFGCEKLPVLSGRHHHHLVSLMPAFNQTAVHATLASLPRRLPDPDECTVLARLVQELYLHPRVLLQSHFREQASIMNGLMWHNVIRSECDMPPLATIDMQWLCSRLVIEDLNRSGTLIRNLLLEPTLLAAIWEELNGIRACWTTEGQNLLKGTFLFWGVGKNGRALALMPSDRFSRLTSYRHPDWSMPLNADTIREYLVQERIVPSLFLSFAATCFARGLLCAGGVFQAAYLPCMLQGLVRALKRCGEPALAERLAGSTPPSLTCTGLLPLRIPRPEGTNGDAIRTGRAAGPAELWLSGGLTPQIWHSLRAVRVSEALAVSLPYHYEDLLGAHTDAPIQQALLRESAEAAPSLPFLRMPQKGGECA